MDSLDEIIAVCCIFAILPKSLGKEYNQMWFQLYGKITLKKVLCFIVLVNSVFIYVNYGKNAKV